MKALNIGYGVCTLSCKCKSFMESFGAKKKKKKVVLSKHAFNKIILEVMHKIILKGEEPEGRMLR